VAPSFLTASYPWISIALCFLTKLQSVVTDPYPWISIVLSVVTVALSVVPVPYPWISVVLSVVTVALSVVTVALSVVTVALSVVTVFLSVLTDPEPQRQAHGIDAEWPLDRGGLTANGFQFEFVSEIWRLILETVNRERSPFKLKNG